MPDFSFEPELIFPLPFDFRRECDAERDGYLDGIVVQLGDGSRYPISCIDFERLEKEVAKRTTQGRPFFANPGLIVVSRVTPWILTLACRWMHSQDYFTKLYPISEGTERLCNPELVFPEGFDSPREEDADRRGYLEDVVVRFDNSKAVPVCFMIPLRLRQEIVADALNGRPFFAEPGLIVLSEINRTIATIAVKELTKEGFFNHLRPINHQE